MKRFIFLVAILAFFSCGNEASQAPQMSQEPIAPIGTTEPQVDVGSYGVRNALIIRNDTGFIKEVNEAKRATAWGSALTLGEQVVFLEEFDTIKINAQGTEWEVAKIRRRDGTEGWAYKAYVIPDAMPGVVIAPDATIYKQPDLAAPTSIILKQGNYLAISSEVVEGGFIKFTTLNATNGAFIENLFLKDDKVSTVESDVQASRFLHLAANAATHIQRRAFLMSADEEFPSDTFKDKIKAELAIVDAEFVQAKLAEKSTAVKTIDIVSAPFAYGSIVGSLTAGTEVTLIRKLTNGTEVWYEILKPTGFVPGYFNVSDQAVQENQSEEASTAQ